MNALNKYLAGVLTVIALGISVIAYSLVFPKKFALEPGAAATGAWTTSRPVAVASGPVTQPGYLVPAGAPYVDRGERFVDEPVRRGGAPVVEDVQTARVYRTAVEPMVVTRPVRAVQTVEVERVPQRAPTRTVERSPGRDWKRTAMVIGGSTAAGAGVGGIFAGKKGALVGAAIAGGVSTIQQTR